MKKLTIFFAVFIVFVQVPYTFGKPFKTAKVKLVDKPVYSLIPAQIISQRDVFVSSKITGFVTGLRVDIGDRIKKGRILLFIDKNTVLQRVKQAADSVKKAKAQLKNAEFNYKKFLSLYKKKVVSKQKFLDMKTSYDVAKSYYEQAISELKVAKITLGYSVIKSPIDGIISAKYVDNGDMASMSRRLLRISSLDHLQVDANISLGLLNLVKSKKTLKIRVGKRIYTAELNHISLVSDPISRTFEIKADLPKNANVNPGEFAYIVLKTKIKPAIVVNKSAITERGSLDGLFVINKKGRTQFRIIKLGERYGNYVEVLSGVFPDETVILNPPLYLSNDSHITDEKQ